MSEDTWSGVDPYFENLLLEEIPALSATLRENEVAGLPAISVSPMHGRLLAILARAIGARKILELGTLGGYSTICLASALPPAGRLITVEVDSGYAEIARRNIARTTFSDRIEIRVGLAIETLPELARENAGPFDLIFIDADKESYADYFPWCMKMSRSGSVIVADNVVRKGEVTDPTSDDPRVQGIQRFIDLVAAEPRIDATAIQTVGSKGHDGFLLALVD
jgi:predicted O-methyltransferase YrrM